MTVTGVPVEAPPAVAKPLEILLLEDNPLDAELTCASLGFEGGECGVERVDDRESFEQALATKCFDLILADYSLPSFDGIAALDIAQQRCPETPFIFVSGALGEELAIETLKRGATDYVLKHRLERLRPSVLRALSEKEQKLQRQRAEERLRELAAENARLYEEARRANRAKDEFIAMISHELRTPMTSIVGWTRMLKLGGLSPEEFEDAINSVERSATVQAQLIDDLLDVSRISTGKLQLQFETVDLGRVVDAVVDSLRIEAREKSIELVANAGPGYFAVRGDRNRLQQVVTNLVQNAVKFTPAGGSVTVTLTESANMAELSVRDTGVGIRPQFLKDLFEPFRQDARDDDGRAGLGLGLSIVRHITERHGGTVTAESEGEGRGATFRVHLPLLHATSSDEGARTAENALPSLANRHILIVEDDGETRRLIAMILTRCDAVVTAVPSVDEAVRVLTDRAWDAVVSDIAMPEADGYELMAEIRRSFGAAAPPVVALTAFGSPEDRRRIHEAGFAKHFIKPVDPIIFARGLSSLWNEGGSV